MFPDWTVIVGFWLGATIGSFLNVVIYRTPRAISLSNPKHSFCPRCKHQLTPLDLIPLLSWLMSKGRCRHCGEKVASRYFYVELLTGLIWAGIWWQQLIVGADPARAFAYWAAASTLVAIIFIDWELYIIPDQINAFLFVVGVIFNGWLYYKGSPAATMWGMPSSVAGAIVGVGSLWGIALFGRVLFRKDAMGHGDIKMARGIGAVLLPATALVSFGMAVVLGAVLGVVQVLTMKPEMGRGSVEGEGADAVGISAEEGTDSETSGPTEGETVYEPESIGSLFKCGLGYLLCLDIIGLFLPKFYMSWFGENPYMAIEEVEDFEVERTMIPFGPYLALGAIVATVFQKQLLEGIARYWASATGGPSFLR